VSSRNSRSYNNVQRLNRSSPDLRSLPPGSPGSVQLL
jgi:hypothetical protein